MKPMLAGAVEFVIGVDTHRDSHTAAVVHATTGGVIEQLTVARAAMPNSHSTDHRTMPEIWSV